jgi:hypothetical protein
MTWRIISGRLWLGESLRLKCACGVAASAGLVAFFALVGIDLEANYRKAALCEWVAAVGLMMSVYSLSMEFSGQVGDQSLSLTLHVAPHSSTLCYCGSLRCSSLCSSL